MISPAIHLAERGILPDGLIRLGIRRLLSKRLRNLQAAARNNPEQYTQSLVDRLANLPIAEATEQANQQHYQVATWFFQAILGPRLKYSSCYYPDEQADLAQAEEEMLRLTAEHAKLSDGQRILELGCGWGSLTLWMAEQFPNARITAVTNSETQAAHIQDQGFFPRFARNLQLEEEWRIHGTHYACTLEAWLNRLDTHRHLLHSNFASDLSAREARVSLQRWRMFLMACAELFAFRGGHEWGVSHYRFGNGQNT